jgi:heme-degrading monooxygenase HmoA
MRNTVAGLTLSLAAASGLLAAEGGATDVAAAASSYLAVPNASASPRTPRMIARIWHGRTVASKADAYEKYLNDAGVAKIVKVPGNLGVEVLRRNQGGAADFIVISYWTSIDAVKNFAGSDYARVKPLDRDREFLIDPESEVVHYEVAKSGAK